MARDTPAQPSKIMEAIAYSLQFAAERKAQGQCLYLLLSEEPTVEEHATRRACVLAGEAGHDEAAFTALYLWLYRERKSAKAVDASFAEEYPEIRRIERVEDFENVLLETGELELR